MVSAGLCMLVSVSMAMVLLCWQYALEACFPLTLALDPR
jgi:hypothetical protein